MKRLVWFILTLLILSITICLSIVLFFQSDYAKSKAEDALVQLIKKQLPYNTHIEEITYLSPFRLECKNITLTDGDEKVIFTKTLSIEWSLRSILSKTLQITSLSINDLKVDTNRLKKTSFSSSQFSEKKSPLPFATHIHNLEIHNLTLGTFSVSYLKSSLKINTKKSKLAGKVALYLPDFFDTKAHLEFKIPKNKDLFKVTSSFNSHWDTFNILLFFNGEGDTHTIINSLKEQSPPHITGAFSSTITPENNENQVQLEGTLSFLDTTTIALENFAAESKLGKVKGMAHYSLDDSTLQSDLQFSLCEASYFSPLQGEGYGELHLNGPLRSPNFSATLHSYQLGYLQWNAEDLELSLKGKLIRSQLQSTFSLNGKSGGVPLQVTGNNNINFNNKESHLSNIEGNIGKNSFSGELLLPPSKPPYFKFSGELSNIPQVSLVLNTPPFKGEFKWSVEGTKTKSWFSIEGSNIEYQRVYWKKAKASGILEGTIKKLSLELDEGKIADTQIKEGYLSIENTFTKKWDLSFHIPESNEKLSYLTLRGTLKKEGPHQFTGKLSQCDLKYNKTAINLKNSFEINSTNSLLSFPYSEWIVGQGLTSFEGSISPTSLSLKSSIHEFPISPFLPLYWKDIIKKGTLTGSANITFNKGLWQGDSELALSSVTLYNSSWNTLVDELNASLSTTFSNEGSLQFNGEVKEKDVGDSIFSGIVPLKTDENISDTTFNLEAPFKVHTEGKLSITPFVEILSQFNDVGSGTARFNIDAKGSINVPNLEGNIFLSDAKYESFYTGIKLKKIYANLQCKGNSIQLKQFKAQDFHKGKGTATGFITLDKSEKFPFQIDANLSNLNVIDLDEMYTTFNGPLYFSGDSNNFKLFGDLETTKTRLLISNETQKPLPKVNVSYTTTPLKKKNTTFISKKNLDLNLKISSNKTTTLEGKGISSTWKGTLTFTHKNNKLQQHGSLSLVDGYFKFAGKTFLLTSGSITFNGASKQDIFINLTATLDIENVIIELLLKGPLTHPQITFNSTPQLQKSELFSLILFNTKTGQIQNPLQAVQAAQNIAEITGNSFPSPDLFGFIKKGLKLDKLEFSPLINQTEDEEEEYLNMGFQIGKYITKNLLLNITKFLDTEGGEISIEADILKKIKAKASIDSDADTSFQLQWKHHY